MDAATSCRPRLRRALRALPGAVAGLLGLTALALSPAPTAAEPDTPSGGIAAVESSSGPGPSDATARRPAADTVVVVVASGNPVEEISRLHLSDLYLGRRGSFPDGRPAEPIDQEPGSDVRRAFYETYLGRSQSEIKAHWSKAVFTGRGRPPPDVEDGEAMKEALAGNPRAIGYIDRSLVDDRVRVVRVTGTD